MSVKIGTVMSGPREVTGGAVQGSVLGVLDHNIVLKNLDDNLLEVYVAKYVDDMTVIDTVGHEVTTDIDASGSRQMHNIHPTKTQEAFSTISTNATKKGLRINYQKTQVLSVSSAYYDTCAIITDNQGNKIKSGNSLKMLGFNFSSSPTIQPQLDYLIQKPTSAISCSCITKDLDYRKKNY